MSREIDIDAAVRILNIKSSNSSHGDILTSQSESTSQGPTETEGENSVHRQPVADHMDKRRRPVHLDSKTMLELANSDEVPNRVELVKSEQQDRLRKIREMTPAAAASFYLQLANSNAGGLRRSSGLMEHLIGLLHLRDHNGGNTAMTRANAASALSLVVEKTAKSEKERKVWELLRLVWYHCECLRGHLRGDDQIATSQHAATISTMTELMTMSFEAETKDFLRIMGTQLCMTTLLRLDHVCYPQLRPKIGSNNPAEGQQAFSLRNSVRVNACTILCNLLVNNPSAKMELALTQGFLTTVKKQLASPLGELVRVSAVLLQNLSFRVDNIVKSELSDANVIPAIVSAASVAQMKPTVVALTSALWNMSAHSSETYESNNKATLCSAAGGMELIVILLDITGDDANTFKILENTAGILQNVSSHIVRHTPLLINVRRLNIYPAMSRCLRRRSTGSMLRSIVGALSNFAAGMAEDKEAIRIAGIIPQLEDIVARADQYSDPKVGIYAKQALTNLNLAPVVETQRRQSYPLQHVRSGSFEHRSSPLTVDSPVETSFRPSPTSSSSDIQEPSVINPSAVHRTVPGRVNQRRQSRMEQAQQMHTSRDNIAINGSRDSLRGVSSENVRSTISADNVRLASNMYRTEGGSGDVPQKPPRKRGSADSNSGQQSAVNPSPFFSAQAPQALAKVTSAQTTGPSVRSQESWHSRSQSDSAATMAHIPSNRLRSHGPKRHGDPTDGITANGRRGHVRQPSTDSASSNGRRNLLSPSPITPSSSQEIMLSQPIHVASDLSPSQSILGSVEEVNVTITQL